jgi:surface antigen
MRATLAWSLVWGAIPMLFAILQAPAASAASCALYARAQTGVDLYGDAGDWWGEAASSYWRGRVPQAGAILVFKRTGVIPDGHVAVVAQVVGPREIVVNQANWYHGMVTRDVPVIDESRANDWTMVAVLDLGSGRYGQGYPTYGFVYPQTGPRLIAASGAASDRDGAATPAVYDPNPRLGVLNDVAVAEDTYRRRNARQRTARGSYRRRAPAQPLRLSSATRTVTRAAGRTYSFVRLDPVAHARRLAVHAASVGYGAQLPTRRAEARPQHHG